MYCGILQKALWTLTKVLMKTILIAGWRDCSGEVRREGLRHLWFLPQRPGCEGWEWKGCLQVGFWIMFPTKNSFISRYAFYDYEYQFNPQVGDISSFFLFPPLTAHEYFLMPTFFRVVTLWWDRSCSCWTGARRPRPLETRCCTPQGIKI